MYSIKRGVSIFMSPEIEKILSVICPVFALYNIPVVITSAVDGPHRENSLHYNFRAIDIRKNFKLRDQMIAWELHREIIFEKMEMIFVSKKFAVIIVPEQDHIHFEWIGK